MPLEWVEASYDPRQIDRRSSAASSFANGESIFLESHRYGGRPARVCDLPAVQCDVAGGDGAGVYEAVAECEAEPAWCC
jgi:hypothetical protein